MDIHSDINWIKAELDHVKDPLLIEAFKNLLNYRRKNRVVTVSESEAEAMIKEGLDDIKHGRVVSTSSLKKQVDTWK